MRESYRSKSCNGLDKDSSKGSAKCRLSEVSAQSTCSLPRTGGWGRCVAALRQPHAVVFKFARLIAEARPTVKVTEACEEELRYVKEVSSEETRTSEYAAHIAAANVAKLSSRTWLARHLLRSEAQATRRSS